MARVNHEYEKRMRELAKKKKQDEKRKKKLERSGKSTETPAPKE